MELVRKVLRSRQILGLAVLVAIVAAMVVPTSAMALINYKISIYRSLTSVYTSQPMTISGQVSPSTQPKTVYIQYKKSTSAVWKSVKVSVPKSGKYKYSFSNASAGKYQIRTKFPTKSKNFYSTTTLVTVKAREKVILASTTSTQDSGLFDVMVPAFEKANPRYDLQVVAVGSGAAMTLGQNKDADVLLVHSPAAEKTFVKNGYGFGRVAVMHNDFLLVGPTDDVSNANISAAGDIYACFQKIDSTGAKFISRYDNSGTHSKEKELWAGAGLTYTTVAANSYYIKANAGMGDTIRITGEQKGYTIVDRATWVTNKPSNLMRIQDKDAALANPYSVIQVTNAKEADGAAAFAKWVVGNSAQSLIYNFGYAKYGQHLFWPDAD